MIKLYNFPLVLTLRHHKKYFKFRYLTIRTMLVSDKKFKQLSTLLQNENIAKTWKTRLKQNNFTNKMCLNNLSN